MSRLDQSWERIAGRVNAVIDAIDRGEDPQPAIKAMHDAAAWETAAIGLAATRDAIERTREADDAIEAADVG